MRARHLFVFVLWAIFSLPLSGCESGSGFGGMGGTKAGADDDKEDPVDPDDGPKETDADTADQKPPGNDKDPGDGQDAKDDGKDDEGEEPPKDTETCVDTEKAEKKISDLVETFVAKYPLSAFEPKEEDADEIEDFPTMTADGVEIGSQAVNEGGGEFVDEESGGVTKANLEKGLAAVKSEAEAHFVSQGYEIKAHGELKSEINGAGTVGNIWGSTIVEKDDLLEEIVYLYVGINFGDNNDNELLMYSSSAVDLGEPCD